MTIYDCFVTVLWLLLVTVLWLFCDFFVDVAREFSGCFYECLVTVAHVCSNTHHFYDKKLMYDAQPTTLVITDL